MTMKPITLLIPLIGIVALLVSGMLRLRSYADIRARSIELQQTQRLAADTFAAETAKTTARYQAGEIDESMWRAETAAISNRFQAASESAGATWVDTVTAADRSQTEGTMLTTAGICATIAMVSGIAWGLRRREIERSGDADPTQ